MAREVRPMGPSDWYASRSPTWNGSGVPPINVDEERRKILDLLMGDQKFYDQNPLAQLLQGNITDRIEGRNQPFTPGVLGGMLSQNADSAAGGFNSQRDLIRQSMANQGLSGSGMETSAILSAMRQQGQNVRTGRRDITTRAQLENFGAAERASEQGRAYLQQRAAHAQAGAQAEAQYRSSLKQLVGEGEGPSNLIQGGNVFGPAPQINPYNSAGFAMNLQNILSENQDYYGNPEGSPEYNTRPIPPSGAWSNPEQRAMNGWTPRVDRGDNDDFGSVTRTIMQSFGLE